MDFEDESSAGKHKKANSQSTAAKKDLLKSIVVAVGSHDGAVQLWNPVEANEWEQFITSSGKH